MASPWSTEKVERLHQMVAADRNGPEIARALGITLNAVYRKMRREGLHVSNAAISRAKSVASRRSAATPEGRAQRSRAGSMPMKRYGFKDARAAHAAAMESRYAGVPPEYRDAYRDLMRKHVRAADAKRMIAEMVAKAKRRRPLTFEEQLERARNGAQIVELYRPVANDTAMGRSLIGCSFG